MKISIGARIVNSAWGGGNLFVKSLSQHLKNKGWDVVYDLDCKDIDLILLIEPRKNLFISKYNQLEIAKYVANKPDTMVVHRINECDERKNTRNVNKYLSRANKVADYTIFISKFLEDLLVNNKYFKDIGDHTYIRNGADRKIFNMQGRQKWEAQYPLKIVTHHWGGNWYKGFDVYEFLDRLIPFGIEGYKIEFTYIGNIPTGFKFLNAKLISPLSGIELANEIKKHHVYLTASQNEPAGMHHIEGAMCGLPLIYRNSGGIPEYAEGFGVMFNSTKDFIERLLELIKNYDYYFNKMDKYPYDSELMCSKYEEVFLKVLERKKSLNLAQRQKKYRNIYLMEKFFYPSYKKDS